MYPAKTKFLIVDDFSTIRDLIVKCLEEIGYSHTLEAQNGSDALRMLKNEAVDFIISDWGMPDMSGLDLLKRCKKDPKLKNIPFIILAAESEQKKILQAAQAGVSDFLVKPVTAQVLKDKLDKIYKKLIPLDE